MPLQPVLLKKNFVSLESSIDVAWGKIKKRACHRPAKMHNLKFMEEKVPVAFLAPNQLAIPLQECGLSPHCCSRLRNGRWERLVQATLFPEINLFLHQPVLWLSLSVGFQSSEIVVSGYIFQFSGCFDGGMNLWSFLFCYFTCNHCPHVGFFVNIFFFLNFSDSVYHSLLHRIVT